MNMVKYALRNSSNLPCRHFIRNLPPRLDFVWRDQTYLSWLVVVEICYSLYVMLTWLTQLMRWEAALTITQWLLYRLQARWMFSRCVMRIRHTRHRAKDTCSRNFNPIITLLSLVLMVEEYLNKMFNTMIPRFRREMLTSLVFSGFVTLNKKAHFPNGHLYSTRSYPHPQNPWSTSV